MSQEIDKLIDELARIPIGWSDRRWDALITILRKQQEKINRGSMAEQLSFLDAVNMVARDLPEDWGISIELEKDSGIVSLTNPMGDFEDFPTNHERLDYTLRDAVDHAIKQDPRYTRGPNPGQINPPSDQE